jgi:hypothetical protein
MRLSKNFRRGLLSTTLFLVLAVGCKKSEDVNPLANLINPSDANKVGAALVMPIGTQTKQGTPPSPSTSAQAPRVATLTPNQPTNNGNNETVSLQYSNVNGNIGGAYGQVVGASSYFDIPLSGNSGTTGNIGLPIGIPADLNSGTFTLAVCVYDLSGRVSNIIQIQYTVTRVDPLKEGEGRTTIGGVTSTATATCDVSIPPYGRAYVISISSSKFIAMYNMRTGGNQFGNAETILGGSSSSTPFALYFDGTTIYGSVSGSANVNGKQVSASGTFREIGGTRQITFSSSGNCK